jgi:heterodisulfide reductase subunit A-like polyferredoxin
VYAAGAAAGSFGIKECIIEGRIAGRSAATPINKKVKRKEINNQIGGA